MFFQNRFAPETKKNFCEDFSENIVDYGIHWSAVYCYSGSCLVVTSLIICSPSSCYFGHFFVPEKRLIYCTLSWRKPSQCGHPIKTVDSHSKITTWTLKYSFALLICPLESLMFILSMLILLNELKSPYLKKISFNICIPDAY